jgi:sulfur carrier protein
MPIRILLNGQTREFAELAPPVLLSRIIADLQLKGDRIAVERNGEIVERKRWLETEVAEGDRLEIVHFVGGGAPQAAHSTVDLPLLRLADKSGKGLSGLLPLALYIISVIGRYPVVCPSTRKWWVPSRPSCATNPNSQSR